MKSKNKNNISFFGDFNNYAQRLINSGTSSNNCKNWATSEFEDPYKKY